jgi:hypothetical protein
VGDEFFHTWTAADCAAITEAQQSLSDNTTNDVSTSKHGYVPKAPNDTTKFLRGDASWAVSAGALVLLEQHTASSSASLDFTTAIGSGYDEYLIELLNLVPATNATHLHLNVSTDGGASYDSGAGKYAWAQWAWVSNGTGFIGSNSDTKMVLSHNNGTGISGTASNGGASGHLRLFSPLSGSHYTTLRASVGFFGSAGVDYAAETRGRYISTTAVNALRFTMSSGNIASGTIRMYGIAKS